MEKQNEYTLTNHTEDTTEEDDLLEDILDDEEDYEEPLLSEERPLPSFKTNRFNHYNASIDAIPLLTFEDEVKYARMVQAGKALNPQDLSCEAVQCRNRAQIARQVLIEHNLRLVRAIARKSEGRGVMLEDLIQEGNIGMMEAVDKYNPEYGFRFSTYAVFNIRQKITRIIQDQALDIRVPNNIQDRIAKIRRIQNFLKQELDHEVTATEIAICNAIGRACFIEAFLSGKSMDELAASLDFGDFSPKSVHDAMTITKPIKSLDDSISSEDEREWIETVVAPEKEGLNPMELSILRAILKKLLPILEKRQIIILAYRYGLCGMKERTYEEIGKIIGVTRERTRQLEKEALESLGTCKDSSLLLAFQG